ncbi:MAG: helix-turn-helix transcriptional regulator [Bacteriovoracaceae bacterium]|nr:helix-turn-helix transcriptional regulator [Bacteriovoracaceae bacterium]
MNINEIHESTKRIQERIAIELGRRTFARSLKTWRECEELSQRELAKKLKITPSTLADLESGRRIPSPKRAAKIANVLGAMPESWIELALQDMIRRDGFNFKISLTAS